jgi:asparagine synthase (glutamine-hydrolysing)
MCGIAGLVDLTGKRPVPPGTLEAMALALFHRGPDEGGFLERPGLGLVSRRLSIVGLSDGQQPIANEDRSVWVVFNGELFDYPERRAELERRGHHFGTHCDTELIPHFWEDHQEGMFDSLRGQFALALYDERQRRLILGRDRFGICPLYWTIQARSASDGNGAGNWLLFASEIKALLASGLVPARPDLRGLNEVFTFFALPGPLTCFEGIRTLLPGHYLRIDLGETADPVDRTYFEIDFPPAGQEERGGNKKQLVEEFEAVLRRAVELRLRADVPVVAYASGGVDSSMIVALANDIRKEPIPTFTVRVDDPRLDETGPASLVARHLGSSPTVVNYGAAEALATYPELIQAAEGPVIDTSCASLLLLAREVHRQGYKVALTGEGADEWLAGYPWYKAHRVLGWLDAIPGLPLGRLARRTYLRLSGAPPTAWSYRQRIEKAVGGSNPWLDIYGLMSMSKLRLFSPHMLDLVEKHNPYDDLQLPLEKMRRWHPFHRGLYFGPRVLLPGLLLSSKGDRVAMHSSVETRPPFLDVEVYSFLARLHPSWKLHGLRDKYLLRCLAERWLPRQVAWRGKVMFRAPLDSFHGTRLPTFVEQLLSKESLGKTGYFDPEAVRHWRQAFRQMGPRSLQRTSIEMGLVGVVATQLWHHTFIDASLADLPSWSVAQSAVVQALARRAG